MWSDRLVFCDCGFQSVCSLMEKDKRLMEAFWWERLTEGETGVVLMGRAMHSKFLILFPIDGQGCVLSLLFDLRSNYGGGDEDNGELLQKVSCTHWCAQCPQPWNRPPPETPGHSWASLGQSLVGSLLLYPRSCAHNFCLCPPRVCFPVLCKFWQLYGGVNGNLSTSLRVLGKIVSGLPENGKQ